MNESAIFTIGHSTLSLSGFVAALRSNGVNAVADVRSTPYSRFNPSFNRESLKNELNALGFHYVFLGKELGGRPADHSFYEDGRASYLRMAQTDEFRSGLNRVIEGNATYRIALMCSEGDPLTCHRALLVSRALVERGQVVFHIERGGKVVCHTDLETRLLRVVGLTETLLRGRDELISEAYVLQAKRVAYAERGGVKVDAETA